MLHLPLAYGSCWSQRPIVRGHPPEVYRLVSAGTVEERILQRAQAKLALDSLVLDTSDEQEMEKLGVDGLLTLIQQGSKAVIAGAQLDRLPRT